MEATINKTQAGKINWSQPPEHNTFAFRYFNKNIHITIKHHTQNKILLFYLK